MNGAKQDSDTVVYGGKVYRKPSALKVKVVAFALGTFVLILAGQLFGPGGVISVLALYAFAKLSQRSQRKRAGRELDDFQSACLKVNVQYRADYSDGDRGLFLALSEAEGRFAVQVRAGLKDTWQQCHIDARRILDVELSINDQSVYKAGPVATLAGAAVGGLMFGGFGAVVGALSTTRAGAGKINSVTLKLRMDDISQPLVELPFILEPIKASSDEAKARMALAEKWTNLIQILRHRVTQPSPAASPVAAAAS